jgi:deoxyribose-phosphate aldolase
MVSFVDIASKIDHSLLKPDLTTQELQDGCLLAHELGVASVCVKPCDIHLANNLLRKSEVIVSTVIGFPHGSTTTHSKEVETQQAMIAGVKEIDAVVNIGRLRSGELGYVERDLKAIIDLARDYQAKVKVIFETSLLNEEQIIALCVICNRLKPDWIKTSTGYGQGGATLEAVQLMKNHIDPSIQIKASAGIKTLDDAIKFVEAGCTRLGTSSTANILAEAKNKLSGMQDKLF